MNAASSTISSPQSASTGPAGETHAHHNIAHILELSVPVAVVIAERPLPVEAILKFTAGTILEFDVPFSSDLSLVVGNRTLGRGQAVKVGEHFGLKITAIDSLRHRIEAMGQS